VTWTEGHSSFLWPQRKIPLSTGRVQWRCRLWWKTLSRLSAGRAWWDLAEVWLHRAIDIDGAPKQINMCSGR